MEKENEMSLTIVTTHKISIEMIADLMVAAFEGGINYWCKKVKIEEFPYGVELRGGAMLASDVIANGGVLKLFDAESDDLWILNRMMVLKGIEMICTDNNETPEEMYEGHDADTADAIVQYALFNEIIFG